MVVLRWIAEQDCTNGEARWDAIDKELEAVKRAIPRIFEPKIDPSERKSIEQAYINMSIYPVAAISFFSQRIIQYVCIVQPMIVTLCMPNTLTYTVLVQQVKCSLISTDIIITKMSAQRRWGPVLMELLDRV